ncbi:MAG: beta-ketoacyl-ACP synthase III [Neisseriaceae bacterium]|nr:beta-ketoacyl-ACP synthase III [Neisseriaceae bacterium]MBR5941006.1 beta-ketoacyl-ACP synthase III [Neisseriaceae bacterium]
MNSVYLNKTAAFLPNLPIDNDTMESVLGVAGDSPSRLRRRILASNGIQSRYYAIDPKTRQSTHSCAELSANAIENLFSNSEEKQQVTLLSCATSYPDQTMPGHGVMVQGLLNNFPPLEAVSLSGVCVAGMAAMKYAFNAVKSGEHNRAISCAAEAASAIMRKENFSLSQAEDETHFQPAHAFNRDFLRWMLSDGAGAFLLSNQAQKGSLKIHWIDLISYANEMPACMYAGGEFVGDTFIGWKEISTQNKHIDGVMNVKQNVKLLNDNVIKYTVEKAMSASLKKHSLKPDEINWFLPHYSSQFFRQKVYDGLKNIGFEIPFEKWFTNLPTKGNTGSASIYIMLDEFLQTHDLATGEKILCYIPESGRFSSSFMLLEVV